jgi:hypothetical protein
MTTTRRLESAERIIERVTKPTEARSWKVPGCDNSPHVDVRPPSRVDTAHFLAVAAESVLR